MTLVLLLTVSAGIILRTMVLRRRQRRLMEEAIRNGTYIPPAVRKLRALGTKPILHDVHLDLSRDYEEKEQLGWWGAIMARPITCSVYSRLT